MMNFNHKTFDDSYLFNKEQDKTLSMNRSLVNFVVNGQRIDKSSPSFRPIIEDVKRMQNSSILHTVLMMDNVVLCYDNVELPRTFKVFEAKDLREGRNGQRKVFIDVTNLITVKDGYFYCKKIDWLISYLFAALGYLLYRHAPYKLLNNSNITISATECFVSLFDYVIDYLRIIGYSQNKTKISYMIALYFQYHLLGKQIDTYTKNIAAKVAGISTTDTRAFELYYKVEDFNDIDSFVTMLADVFKLKGLTTEVFIHKWMHLIGTNTPYATELFTSFSSILTHAYCGSYIVNQKQIERCCGKAMVTYSVALLKIGVEEFDKRGFMENMEFEETVGRDKSSCTLAEAVANRRKVPEDCKFVKSDYASKAATKERVNKMVAYYRSTEQESKIGRKIVEAANGANTAMNHFAVKGESSLYEFGVLEIILRVGKEYLESSDKRELNNLFRENYDKYSDNAKESYDDKEKGKRFRKIAMEIHNCLKYV